MNDDGRLYIPCVRCGLVWNVSVKRDMDKLFVCPNCEEREMRIFEKANKRANQKAKDDCKV